MHECRIHIIFLYLKKYLIVTGLYPHLEEVAAFLRLETSYTCVDGIVPVVSFQRQRLWRLCGWVFEVRKLVEADTGVEHWLDAV
jgi:hypothetical protein